MLWRTRIVSLVTTTALAVTGGAVAAEAAAPLTNPYLGARGYVDPEWSAAARAEAARGGDLAAPMTAVSRRPTAVWLDSIASITGTPDRRGLRAHLDGALAQQRRGGRPVVVTLVLYNLPDRSCSRAPSGELTVALGGVEAYRTQFIDPIAAILADPAYRRLRIAVVVEPDALGDFVYPGWTYECELLRQAGVYLTAVPYAMGRLHEAPNVFAYLDVTGSNRVGWPDTFATAVRTVREVADRTPGGVASVDGVAVGVADYVPLDEPFLDIGMTRNGVRILQSRWVDWNDHLEESTFVDALHAGLVGAGFGEHIGALVDTSRNGWGGPDRPVAQSTSYSIDTFVDESRVDRRPARYTWCNQVGAGLGEPPQAAPREHVHAYAWVKQPGVSDGAPPGILDDNAGDIRCDPNGYYPPIGGSNRPTGAMAGAPARGEWFPAAFTELVRNANPPAA